MTATVDAVEVAPPAPPAARPASKGGLSSLPPWLAEGIRWVLGFASVLVFTQFVVQNSAGKGPRGTPAAFLFQGVVTGLILALVAVGIVLIYRTIRVINFAATALGAAASTWLTHTVAYNRQVPFFVLFAVGLLIGALTGVAFDLVFGRRFAKSARLVMTVIMISGAQWLQGVLIQAVFNLPIFPLVAEREPADLAPDRIARLLPYSGTNFTVGDFPQRFGFAELFCIEASLGLIIALGLYLRYSRTGTAIRAAAENADRASMLGIGVGMLGTIAWALAGALGAAAAMLGAVSGRGLAQAGVLGPGDISLLLPPLAAAVLAKFQSIPRAVAVSVGIQLIAAGITSGYQTRASAYINLALLVIVVGGLAIQRKELFRLSNAESSSWAAVVEPRPIPAELRKVRGVMVGRYALIAIFIAIAVAFPFFASINHLTLMGGVFLGAITGLSLVVLTGWAGQVSVGQTAFVGIGAMITGQLTQKGVPFLLAIPLGAVLTGIVAGLVGLPALRIRGLYLAAATFAMACAAGAVFQNTNLGPRLLPSNLVRPVFLFIDLEQERNMYFFCLASLIFWVAIVANLRRSRFGRLLIGLRDNEANIQSFGISVVRLKLMAFALAGGMAGFSGAMFEMQLRGANGDAFSAQQSLYVFTNTLLGGVSSPLGALIGAGYGALFLFFFGSNQIALLVLPTIPLFLLYAQPGGVVALVNNGRDSILRIVAQRRQIVVPSLFADYDPEAVERKLIPLGETDNSSGLAALPGDVRYTYESDLYKGGSSRVLAGINDHSAKTQSDEMSVLTAAAESRETPLAEVDA